MCISYTFKLINCSILPFCKAINAFIHMTAILSKRPYRLPGNSKVQPRRNPSWRTQDLQKNNSKTYGPQ